jgi:hypothetical protein
MPSSATCGQKYELIVKRDIHPTHSVAPHHPISVLAVQRYLWSKIDRAASIRAANRVVPRHQASVLGY